MCAFCTTVLANSYKKKCAQYTYSLLQTVPPLIRIQNQRVGVANGSTGVLKCDVEAFPEAVRYWERADGRLLEDGDKYHMSYSEKDRYKVSGD
jgi:hypothetical protein